MLGIVIIQSGRRQTPGGKLQGLVTCTGKSSRSVYRRLGYKSWTYSHGREYMSLALQPRGNPVLNRNLENKPEHFS